MPLVSLSRLLRFHADSKPAGALAVSHGSDRLTWDQLDRRSNARARAFQRLGVKPNDFVTIVLPNGNRYVETVYAIWKCGATPNPVASKLPIEELRAIVEVARPTLVVGGPPDDLDGVARIAADFDPGGESEEALPEVTATYWKAMTSGGSTGRPKVIVDHIPAMCDTDTPMVRMTPGGAILNPGPLYHNGPFSTSMLGMFIGKHLVGMTRFDPKEALRLIQDERVDWAYMVPTMMNRIWALPPEERSAFDLSSLKTILHTAGPIAPWLKEEWLRWIGPEKVLELYGGTERQGNTLISGDEWLTHRGSVGKPAPGVRMRVVNEKGEECAPGEVGEIYMMPDTGPGSTYHYLGAEARKSGDGWESIGDIGWMDADGYLYLADRRTDLILRGGANIYPAEVEAALESHPGVACAIVVGLPDDDLGQRVHAIIEPRPEARASLSPEAVAEHVATKLAKYKCPESYEITPDMLRDEAGKARRTAIRDAAIARRAAAR